MCKTVPISLLYDKNFLTCLSIDNLKDDVAEISF